MGSIESRPSCDLDDGLHETKEDNTWIAEVRCSGPSADADIEVVNVATTPALVRIMPLQELFESVLLQLPLRDLLLAQRVDRHWNSTIRSSPKIQEALFFKPQTSNVTKALPARGRSGHSKEDFERNPLLEAKFSPFFRRMPGREYSLRLLNNKDDLMAMEWSRDDRTRAVYEHPDASWRRMLVVQPLVDTVEVLSVRRFPARDFLETATVACPAEALRMGWLYAQARRSCIGTRAFRLRWHMIKSDELWQSKLTVLLHYHRTCTRRSFAEDEAMVPKGPECSWSACHLTFTPHPLVDGAGPDGDRRVPHDLLCDREDFANDLVTTRSH